MIALDPAFLAGLIGKREASCVKQSVENGEVGIETVGEDAVKIELKVAELDEPGTVAEKPKNPAAVALGRKGGKATSDAKAEAARANGAKGGRPKKTH